MSEWKEVKFQETFEIPLRNGLTKPTKIRGNGLPMINMREIFSYDKINNQVTMELVPVNEKEKVALLKYDDVLFARQSLVESGAGKVSIFKGNKPTVFEGHLIRCRVNQNIAYPDFVYYYWKSPIGKGNMSTIVTQTAAAGIKGSVLQNLLIPLPPLPEQKAIAAVLSSLDDKIDLLHRQNKTLEQMAETLFRQWFVVEADEGWEVVKIGDFVKTNINSVNKNYPHQIIKYLDTGSLIKGKIEILQEFNFNEAPSRAKRLVQHNDVLISTVRPNQKHYGIVKNPIDNLVVSTGFCVITCENIDPHFIYILLTTSDMTEYLHSIAEGSTSTYPSLKPKDIEVIEFQLPPDALLLEFSQYCKNAWDKIDKNQTQIRTLEKMRDTLLPKLMSGEVVLSMS